MESKSTGTLDRLLRFLSPAKRSESGNPFVDQASREWSPSGLEIKPYRGHRVAYAGILGAPALAPEVDADSVRREPLPTEDPAATDEPTEVLDELLAARPVERPKERHRPVESERPEDSTALTVDDASLPTADDLLGEEPAAPSQRAATAFGNVAPAESIDRGREVINELLEDALRTFDRALVFLDRPGGLECVAARGRSIDSELELFIPASLRSTLGQAKESGRDVIGHLAPLEGNELLVEGLRGVVPELAVALPLIIEGRASLVLYCDSIAGGRLSLAPTQRSRDAACEALERELLYRWTHDFASGANEAPDAYHLPHQPSADPALLSVLRRPESSPTEQGDPPKKAPEVYSPVRPLVEAGP